MKILKIDGKEYTLMYSFRAARYKKCVEIATAVAMKIQEAIDNDDKETLMSEIAGLPSCIPYLLYGGLIQIHGNHSKGDGTVTSVEQVEDMLDLYLEDNPDDTYYSMYMSIMECMADDGFFRLIGLGETEDQPTRKKRKSQKKEEVSVS